MEKGPLPDEYMIYGEQLAEPVTQEVSEAEHLLEEFESHDVKEGAFIRQYKEIAANTKDSLIKFLLQLIISDEERHHAIIHSMAESLKGSLQWTKQEGALPSLSDLGEEKEELLKLTADFIHNEKQGIKDTRKLVKESAGYYRGLFPLLLKATIHDSEKHVEVLEFLQNRVKEA